MTRHVIAALAAVLLLTACGNDGPDGPAAQGVDHVTSNDRSGPGSGTGAGDASGNASDATTRAEPGDELAATGVGGRVVTTDGTPVSWTPVARQPVDGTRPVTQEAGVTDEDGRYFWPLEPGTWDITVSAPGHEPVTQRVTLDEAQRATLDFVVGPRSGQ